MVGAAVLWPQVEHGSLCGYVVERSSTRWSRMNVSLACEILMNQTVHWPNAVFYGLLPLKFAARTHAHTPSGLTLVPQPLLCTTGRR